MVPYTSLHGVKIHKAGISISRAVRTSNLGLYQLLFSQSNQFTSSQLLTADCREGIPVRRVDTSVRIRLTKLLLDVERICPLDWKLGGGITYPCPSSNTSSCLINGAEDLRIRRNIYYDFKKGKEEM